MTEIFCLIYKIQETKIHGISRFPAGSFVVLVADQLWYNLGIISGLAIISGAESFRTHAI